ncbi:ABC transporter ATP-binding protein [Mesorhizobium sp. LHD-90]|uniref:ABC transporter ATP-binding protein n=1 Tax=Mesorhizobium sp. LHD-90 TaxID=3071414 RepID=UPI0027E072B4|nr:ABC transporter ATP-binding protein [Mesorhizobium sp. LHD-90]MDQ6433824.1 ABC transporter ATP-binding protein [Mesorhizobium sp. LHD-90]
MTAPILTVSNLAVSVHGEDGEREVVSDLSFALQKGETLCIAGESGSGKSMTALAIMGLLPQPGARVSAGSIRLGDTDLATLSENRMRTIRGDRIAMIFQEPMTSLNPVLSIGRQLTEAIEAHTPLSREEARRRAVEALKAVRIPEAESRLKQFPHELSGGMRQRVMIAMALALKPDVLICDEPTTALDVTVQGEVLELLRDLQREQGTSIILITHDMGVVAEMADRVIVMRHGRMVEEGFTSAIFAIPREDYTRELLAAVPRIGGGRAGQLAPSPALRFARATSPQRGKEIGEAGAALDIKHGLGANGGKPPLPGGERVAEPRLDRGSVGAEGHDPSVRDPGGSGGRVRGPTTEPAVAAIHDLTVRFDLTGGFFGRVDRRVHAVEGVGFTIGQNETLSLVGESGCGKSTTAKAIAGLVPYAGKIEIGGRDLASLGRAERMAIRRDVQMVFQDPYASLDPRMRVGELVEEPLVIHGIGDRKERRDRVAALFERVGLSADQMERYPHEFSGGQRQRICIARALALRPKLIIADESVSALDVSVQARVLRLLKDLQREFGVAYLFISHDMAVVENISDRVAVMYLGQIVEMGTRDQIFASPRHPYTKRLIEAVPIPDPSRRRARFARLDKEIPSAVRRVGDEPPKTLLRDFGEGHLVSEFGL